MALRWQFNEVAGKVTENRYGKEITFPFYEGNALMIVTHEYEENGQSMYNMQWFFLDEAHAKNCLGLQKNAQGVKDNMFGEDGITSLTIYRDHCRNWKKIIDLFTKAFPHISIELMESAPAA